MQFPDLMNGAFEIFGGLFVALNVRRLWIDRTLAGVDWRTMGFFTSWGYWNLYYYPHLDQWVSFYGGVAVTAANTAWMLLYASLRWTRPHNTIA